MSEQNEEVRVAVLSTDIQWIKASMTEMKEDLDAMKRSLGDYQKAQHEVCRKTHDTMNSRFSVLENAQTATSVRVVSIAAAIGFISSYALALAKHFISMGAKP